MDGETSEAFGVLMRRHRRDRGWTQAELAERAQMSVEAIGTLERGTRRAPWPDTVARVAEALGLTDDQVAALTSSARAGRHRDDDDDRSRLPPTNLPHDATSFIGRERELSEVTDLLLDPHVRLVTLTGPGGVGKTRLAIETCRAVSRHYPDGVFWVSLASLSDPDLVPTTLAGALAIKPKAGTEILDTVSTFLAGKHVLLLLDNFEHILAAATVVANVLSECRGVDVLVISRAPLRIRGEHQYDVPQLSLPDPGHDVNCVSLSRYEAVALFRDRARSVKSDFQLTESNASAVAAICARLDGLPLAIELAAARIKLFEPEALLQRLSQRMTLLTAGATDAPHRHQTMRAAIDWSYSLLTEEERTLFARLAVFSGGCTYRAAEAVCATPGEPNLLEGVASLIDKSLMRRVGEGEPRFLMLETIREYAGEKLEGSEEAEQIRGRHAVYFRTIAHQGYRDWFGPKQPSWVRYFEAEQDNFRAALAWCLQEEHVGLGLALAIDLSRHWTTNVRQLQEGQRWFERLLERDDHGENIQFRTRALSEASWLAARSGDWERGLALAEGCLTLARQSEARLRVGVALTTLAIHTWTSGHVDRACALQAEGLEIVRQLGDRIITAIALQNLGSWTAYQGNHERALPLLWESVDLWREVGDMRCLAFPLRHLSIVSCRLGDLDSARTLLREGLGPSGSTGDQLQVAEYLEEFAVLAVHTAENDRAARLWGAANAFQESAGLPLDWAVRERHDRYQARARAHVTESHWKELSAKGAAMTLEQAIAYALEDPGYRLPVPSRELLDSDIQPDDCEPAIVL